MILFIYCLISRVKITYNLYFILFIFEFAITPQIQENHFRYKY